MPLTKILIITDAVTKPLYTPRVRNLYHYFPQKGIEIDWFTEQYETIPSDFNIKLHQIRLSFLQYIPHIWLKSISQNSSKTKHTSTHRPTRHSRTMRHQRIQQFQNRTWLHQQNIPQHKHISPK